MVRKFIDRFIKPWFFEWDGNSEKYVERIKPVRVIITLFVGIFAAAVFDKIINPGRLSDMFVGGLVLQITSLIGMDTWRANSKDRTRAESENFEKEI